MSVLVALVSGAARGIGRQVAVDLAEHGYTVVLSTRDAAQAGAAAAELSAHRGLSELSGLTSTSPSQTGWTLSPAQCAPPRGGSTC